MGEVYFTPIQCQNFQNIAAQAYLSKLVFNRKIPKEILYSPTKMGGWGENELFSKLAVQKTNIFLGHTWNRYEM